jgi:hypothetical protein
MRYETFLALSVAGFATIGAGGCARASPDAAAAIADRYYEALARADAASACALMTERQRTGFEGGTCEQVMQFVLQTDGPPGRRALAERGVRITGTGDRQTVELRYQVAYRSGVRVEILTIQGQPAQPDSFRIDGIARQEPLPAE